MRIPPIKVLHRQRRDDRRARRRGAPPRPAAVRLDLPVDSSMPLTSAGLRQARPAALRHECDDGGDRSGSGALRPRTMESR